MSYDRKLYAVDALKGGHMELGQVTHDAASLGAGASREDTITLTGNDTLKLGTNDIVFVNVRNADTGIVVTGARVTAADTLKIKLYNPTGSGVDAGSLTIDVMVFHIV